MRTRTVHVAELTEPLGQDADIAVVVDVIRAFTVAPWCLERGALRHLLAPSLDAAVTAGDRFPGSVLLKDGAPDPRFDLVNAPGAIATSDLTGRTVIQKTGNGTRGAHAARGAGEVLCASFVTAAATTAYLRHRDASEVVFVVTEGDEDAALADYVIACLDGPTQAAPFVRRVLDSDAAEELRQRAPDPAFPGVHPDDLERVIEMDRFDRALRCEPVEDLLEVRHC